MRIAPQIELSETERKTLVKWSRGRSTPARVVQRANIVLLAADGLENREIARSLGVMERTVGRWRTRFHKGGLVALEKDLPRGGRHATQRQKYESLIIKKVQDEKPANATHCYNICQRRRNGGRRGGGTTHFFAPRDNFCKNALRSLLEKPFESSSGTAG